MKFPVHWVASTTLPILEVPSLTIIHSAAGPSHVHIGNAEIVSRVHCEINWDESSSSFTLVCKSKNGCLVDGKQVSRYVTIHALFILYFIIRSPIKINAALRTAVLLRLVTSAYTSFFRFEMIRDTKMVSVLLL